MLLSPCDTELGLRSRAVKLQKTRNKGICVRDSALMKYPKTILEIYVIY